jgi:hypothetical protein
MSFRSEVAVRLLRGTNPLFRRINPLFRLHSDIFRNPMKSRGFSRRLRSKTRLEI